MSHCQSSKFHNAKAGQYGRRREEWIILKDLNYNINHVINCYTAIALVLMG